MKFLKRMIHGLFGTPEEWEAVFKKGSPRLVVDKKTFNLDGRSEVEKLMMTDEA